MPPPRRAAPGGDLLRLPVLGAFLRWRHARTTLQVLLLGGAVVILLDGFFGPQLAPRNLAGTLPWVHWRGFVVLALLVAGNLFCMACPFMLPRRLARRWFTPRANWPRALGSKWVAVALLLLFFWAYEAFQLWSSPWLTAWVALTYFVLAFAVDAFFRGATFCKHLCPIGQFHFVNSMVSPTEVRVRDLSTCDTCTTRDCIRGRYEPSVIALAREGRAGRRDPGRGPGQALGREGLVQRGCELALFQPRKEGNMDCTYCLECVHACPHDNIGILLRSPVRELSLDPPRSGVGRLSMRPDLAALAGVLVFGAYFNAFGMVGPGAEMRDAIARALPAGWDSLAPAVSTGVVLLLGMLALPLLLLVATGWGSALLVGNTDPAGDPPRLARTVQSHLWGLVPVGFAMWLAHYLYHLLIGGLTIVPLLRGWLADLGLVRGGVRPIQDLGTVVPESWILPLQVGVLQVGLLLSLVAGFRIAEREHADRTTALRAFLPWAILAILLTLSGTWLLGQPMEMRGTFRGP